MSESYWNKLYCSREASRDYDGWLDKYSFAPGSAVLDLGCGAGTNLPFLLGCGAVVTAADLSPESEHLVKEAFGNRLAAVDCFDMREGFPYGDGSFDAIVADLSLHYFSWEDTVRIVDGLHRILKAGGRLIARVHAMENLPEDAVYIAPGYYRAYGLDRRYFTEGDIRQLFCKWKLSSLAEAQARRYSRVKKVFEFTAERL